MGLTPNVVANTPILSTWGNEVRDRSLQNFATAAERAAQWLAPPEGAISYLRDVDRIDVYTGTAWTPYGNVVAATAGRNLIQAGSLSAVTGATGNLGITFPVAYSVAPLIVVSPGDTAGGLAAVALSGVPTGTGFTVICFTANAQMGNGVTVRVNWIAIGAP